MSTRFLPCRSDNATGELLLVEGQSALHAVDQVRDPQSQAVLALQGKIPNPESRPKRVIDRNPICQELFQTLACGSGEACDLSLMRYSNVTILSDPDIDGAHSRYLLMLLFQLYLQPLVQAGKLLLVICPRYRYTTAATDLGRDIDSNSTHYFSTDEEKQAFLDSQGAPNTGRMTQFKGLGSLSNNELSQLVVAKKTRREVILR